MILFFITKILIDPMVGDVKCLLSGQSERFRISIISYRVERGANLVKQRFCETLWSVIRTGSCLAVELELSRRCLQCLVFVSSLLPTRPSLRHLLANSPL